ncbi:hypothetical protein ROZALSC1DRAFT_29213 [Rozella allomycis CSF55]|uniref:Uncharacterized protein n=1 Tax=Rozella allomycis (strain CSF55) TaxID=988480 RepID=A0A4P9YII3_ROZAC|nr:hypothetical protein ROZALSC1DRAFT_29213 [Rozella allomycis CSF55]
MKIFLIALSLLLGINAKIFKRSDQDIQNKKLGVLTDEYLNGIFRENHIATVGAHTIENSENLIIQYGDPVRDDFENEISDMLKSLVPKFEKDADYCRFLASVTWRSTTTLNSEEGLQYNMLLHDCLLKHDKKYMTKDPDVNSDFKLCFEEKKLAKLTPSRCSQFFATSAGKAFYSRLEELLKRNVISNCGGSSVADSANPLKHLDSAQTCTIEPKGRIIRVPIEHPDLLTYNKPDVRDIKPNVTPLYEILHYIVKAQAETDDGNVFLLTIGIKPDNNDATWEYYLLDEDKASKSLKFSNLQMGPLHSITVPLVKHASTDELYVYDPVLQLTPKYRQGHFMTVGNYLQMIEKGLHNSVPKDKLAVFISTFESTLTSEYVWHALETAIIKDVANNLKNYVPLEQNLKSDLILQTSTLFKKKTERQWTNVCDLIQYYVAQHAIDRSNDYANAMRKYSAITDITLKQVDILQGKQNITKSLKKLSQWAMKVMASQTHCIMENLPTQKETAATFAVALNDDITDNNFYFGFSNGYRNRQKVVDICLKQYFVAWPAEFNNDMSFIRELHERKVRQEPAKAANYAISNCAEDQCCSLSIFQGPLRDDADFVINKDSWPSVMPLIVFSYRYYKTPSRYFLAPIDRCRNCQQYRIYKDQNYPDGIDVSFQGLAITDWIFETMRQEFNRLDIFGIPNGVRRHATNPLPIDKMKELKTFLKTNYDALRVHEETKIYATT